MPVDALVEQFVLFGALAVRLDHVPALVLQEEPLRLIIQRLLVDIVLLLSLDQGDYVQIFRQFSFPVLEESVSLLCRFESLRAPILNQLLSATAEHPTDLMQHSVQKVVLEQCSVHNELVEEVELLLLGLDADVWFLDAILNEFFHLLLVQVQLIRRDVHQFALRQIFGTYCP